MATSEDIAQTIDLSNDLLALLQTLIDSGRSSVYVPFIYDAPEVYLVALVTSLTLIHHILAVNEINAVIGNTLFEGEAADGSPLPFATLRAIRVTVVGTDDDPDSGCDNEDVNTEVACLVDAATEFPELDPAVKQRIITEVDNKVSFNYTGRYSNDVAYPVTINGQDYPWDDPQVPASALYEAIPFVYDREAAVSYTITRSQDDFEQKNPSSEFYFKAGAGDQLSGVPLGVSPGPADVSEERFRYSTLTHQTGSTGSAYFISEMLYFGGKLPMSTCDDDDIDCEPEELVDVTNMWLARCGTGPNLEATSSWRDHRLLMGYFIEEHARPPLSADDADIATRLQDTIFWRHPDNIASLASQNALDQYSSLPFDDPLFVADDLNRYMDFRDSLGTGGDWKPGAQQAASQYLFGRFSADGMSDLNTGDYVFLDLGSETSSHGLLIVGWGDAVNSTEGINTIVGRNGFTIERQPNKIPYVADFAYGYNSLTNDTGFLQDIRPRPFYSVIAPISNSQLQQVIGNLGSSRNNFIVNQLSDYTARLRGSIWGSFRFPDQSSPDLRFFKFTSTSNTLTIPFKQLFSLQLPC